MARARGWKHAGDLIDRLSRERVLFRPRDVEALGISRNWAKLMIQLGELKEVAPAVYTRWRRDFPPVTIAATKMPRGVACLTTALKLHGWDEVDAKELWWAIPRTARKPKHPPVPIRFLRLGPASFERDVELHRMDGVEIRVYSLQRTLADCIRFRDRLVDATQSAWWPRLLALGGTSGCTSSVGRDPEVGGGPAAEDPLPTWRS